MIMATKLDKDLTGDIKKAVKLVGGFEKSLKRTNITHQAQYEHRGSLAGGGDRPCISESSDCRPEDQGYTNLSVADTCRLPRVPTKRVINLLGLDAVCKTELSGGHRIRGGQG